MVPINSRQIMKDCKDKLVDFINYLIIRIQIYEIMEAETLMARTLIEKELGRLEINPGDQMEFGS